MRYIGNKENILENIYSILQSNEVQGKTFFDFFAGTTNVGRFFKSKDYQVFSSDILYLSYCLQKAYIENNSEPKFEKLLNFIPQQNTESFFSYPLEIVVGYLNTLEGVEGFIYKTIPSGTKTFLNLECILLMNGKIDAIRQQRKLKTKI